MAQTLDHPDLPKSLRPGHAVAVKQVLCSHLDAHDKGRAVAAFEQEASLLARLDCDGLVRVFEQLEWQEERYLVMEFVDGWTLSQVIKRLESPLPFPRAQSIARQLCKVLGYLHSLEPPVIFRDLKPSNIMIDRSGRVTLIDFGIARVFEDETQTQTCLRGMGSAGYSPLEQYAGGTDRRSDIYSLGATLYTLVTHQIPSPAALRAVAAESLKEIESFNPEVPAYWRQAIKRMLRMRPEERYASLAEVEQALMAPPEDDQSTTTLLLAPSHYLDLEGAWCWQRLGIRQVHIGVAADQAVSWQDEKEVGPADLILALRDETDERSGIFLVMGEKEKKSRFKPELEGLTVYLLFGEDASAGPETVMPVVKSCLSQFCQQVLDHLADQTPHPTLLRRLRQVAAHANRGQAARLEMGWLEELQQGSAEDWGRLARQLSGEEANQCLQQVLLKLRSAHEPGSPGEHSLFLERLKKLGDDGALCSRWLAEHSPVARKTWGLDWLKLEVKWREAYADQFPLDLAECRWSLATQWLSRHEYAKAEPLARAALETAERLLGSQATDLSPYLKLYADVCEHCGKAKQSTEYRTRALLLKHRRS